MNKLKENKEIVMVGLVLIIGAFYWVEMRPVNIKKECSLVTKTIPADLGVTKEQAEVNKIAFEQCKTDNQGGRLFPISAKCWPLEQDSKERLPQPEREETREATKTEYDKCLRHNGL